MTETPSRLSMSIAIFCTAFMLQTAHADQALVPVAAPDHFIIQLPEVDREALVEQVGALRSQLIQLKQVLIQSVADKKLNSNDAIITVIMPGGLLYAGYKKVRYEQAKKELARVSDNIEEFSGDILAMQPRSASVAIVARQP